MSPDKLALLAAWNAALPALIWSVRTPALHLQSRSSGCEWRRRPRPRHGTGFTCSRWPLFNSN